MKVIIVGGGFCGALVAKKLEKFKNISTTLIDKKTYFEYQPSLPKVIYKPSYILKIRKQYSSFLKNTNIIVEQIKKVSKNYIETTKSKISYDILVVSTGIEYPIFLKNKKNVHILKNGYESLEISKKIKNSSHVLIVGGGVIGTEVAGEIVEKFPNINLTIIHSQNKFLNRLPIDASEYVLSYFIKNGVDIIFEDKVIENKKGVFITKKGREISADLCIWCAGIKYNPYFMKNFSNVCFSKRNALNVNDYLQLKGIKNIFIGGDLTSIIEEKTARKSELHAKIIVKNIKNKLHKKPLIAYRTGTSPMVISLGDWRGIIIFKYVFPGLFIPGILKWLIQWWFIRSLK
jgi:NADH dehydrogenase FAD-containing subunit